MNSVKDKLEKWLADNPDGWLTESDQTIAEQAEISAGSVGRNLYVVVAKRDNVMPSEVRRRRQEARPIPRRTKVDLDRIREIIEANPEIPDCDLAFMADCSENTIERVRKTMRQGNEELPEDNVDEIQDIKSEIETICSDLDNVKTSVESLLTRIDNLTNA